MLRAKVDASIHSFDILLGFVNGPVPTFIDNCNSITQPTDGVRVRLCVSSIFVAGFRRWRRQGI